MLLRQRMKVDLVSAIVHQSAPTSLVTEEGLPVSVPSSLLRLFSPLLAELLDLPPCVSTSIILPDTNIKTLSLLIDLIKDGKSTQDFVSIESIQDLAGSLGIDLRNVNVSTGSQIRAGKTAAGASKPQRTVPVISRSESAPAKLKPTKNPKKVTKAKTKTSLLSNIKEERSEESISGSGEKNSSYNCQVCEKTFNGINPLAFHYCKHFFKDLQSLNFQDFVDGNNCTKCNRTFPDKKAILCHVGVKHKYINFVLSANGLSKIPLGQGELPPLNPPSGISIKKEQAAVVLTDPGANSTKKAKKLPVRVSFSGSKSRNSKDVKEIKVCEICDKEQENMSKLVNHMIGSHLLTEIKQKYAHLYNGKECLECNKPFAKGSVWGHLGAVHNKLDEVLIERGLRPIKVPPTPTLRQVFVKSERMEQEEEMGGEEQELQISNLFASYDAATTEGGDPCDPIDSHDVEMAADPLV